MSKCKVIRAETLRLEFMRKITSLLARSFWLLSLLYLAQCNIPDQKTDAAEEFRTEDNLDVAEIEVELSSPAKEDPYVLTDCCNELNENHSEKENRRSASAQSEEDQSRKNPPSSSESSDNGASSNEQADKQQARNPEGSQDDHFDAGTSETQPPEDSRESSQDQQTSGSAKTNQSKSEDSRPKIALIGDTTAMGFAFDTTIGQSFANIPNGRNTKEYPYVYDYDYQGYVTISLRLKKYLAKELVSFHSGSAKIDENDENDESKDKLLEGVIRRLKLHYGDIEKKNAAGEENPQLSLKSKLSTEFSLTIHAGKRKPDEEPERVLALNDQIQQIETGTKLILWYIGAEYLTKLGDPRELDPSGIISQLRAKHPGARVMVVPPTDPYRFFENKELKRQLEPQEVLEQQLEKQTAFEFRVKYWGTTHDTTYTCKSFWEKIYPSLLDRKATESKLSKLREDLEMITDGDTRVSILEKTIAANKDFLSYDCLHLNQKGLNELNQLIRQEIKNVIDSQDRKAQDIPIP